MTTIVADCHQAPSDAFPEWEVDVVLSLRGVSRIVTFQETACGETSELINCYKKVILRMGEMLEDLLPEYMNDEVLGTALDSTNVYTVTS